MSAQKELRYFWRDDWRALQDWYESQFVDEAPIRGESTPAYAAYPYRRNVPERMHELIPGAKLIYLVRDPIDRLLSHWVQRRSDGDRTPFARFMAEYDRPDNPIVCPSRYWLQLERFLRFYSRDRVLVLDQSDLKTRRIETMAQVFRFLGVDDSFRSEGFIPERNTHDEKTTPRAFTVHLMDRVLFPLSRSIPTNVRDVIRRPANRVLFGPPANAPLLTPDAHARLTELLAPEVEKLRRFSGHQFASWSL